MIWNLIQDGPLRSLYKRMPVRQPGLWPGFDSPKPPPPSKLQTTKKPAPKPKRRRIRKDKLALLLTKSFSNGFLAFSHLSGSVLLAISDVMFFVSLAGSFWLAQLVSGGLAVVFALGEVALWDRGRIQKKKSDRLIALVLAVFTGFSMVALSLPEVIAENKEAVYEEAAAKMDANATQLATDAARATIEALSSLPGDFGQSKREIAESLKGILAEIPRSTEDRPAAVVRSSSGDSPLLAFGGFVFALVFLIVRAVCLQLVVLGTAPKAIERKPRRAKDDKD